MLLVRTLVIRGLLFAQGALWAASSPAGLLWDESVSGDLSSSQSAPSAFNLAVGTNSIIGTVTGGTDTQDWVALTVPAGDELSSIILAAYQSTDSQGFTGFQVGSSFVGNPLTAAPYAGYSHFGTNATNGSLPPANLVNQDLLPLMANPAVAAGASGFTPPLGPGTYTFLIQQLGAATSYQFNYNVTRAPEPATLGMLGTGLLSLAMMRLRTRRRGR